jgi:hypothetical protein
MRKYSYDNRQEKFAYPAPIMKKMQKKFRLYGRSYHLVIENAGDLEKILDFDEALWIATSAPLNSFNIDPVFILSADGDGDNRIIPREFKGSITWLLRKLTDTSGIDRKSTTLRPASVNGEDAEGRKVCLALDKMVSRFDLDPEEGVTIEAIRKVLRELESQPASEAGIVLPAACEDERIRRFVDDVMAVTGGRDHPGGGKGIGREDLDAFLELGRRFVEWHDEGTPRPGESESALLPLGEKTHESFPSYSSLKEKLDQYFAHCEAVELDEELKGRIWPREEQKEELIDLTDVEQIRLMLVRSPLAEPNHDRILDFDGKINPHYSAAVEDFRRQTVGPLLGEGTSSLSDSDWHGIKARFKAYEEWSATKPAKGIDRIGCEGFRRYLDPLFEGTVAKMIDESSKSAFTLENVRLAEKLALFQANMLDLANNFVSFPHLYDPERRAAFEEGSLVIDGRRFNLAVRVHDRKEHIKVADAGTMFVMYVEIEHRRRGLKYEVAIPATAGTQGTLTVGKRGVFEHIDGTEWFARIVHISDHPISLPEALIDPLKRLGRALVQKVEAVTSSAEKELDKAGAATVSQVSEAAAPAGAPQAGAAQQRGGAGGMLAGGGIAIAAVGSSLAFITSTFAKLNAWQIISGLGVALLAVIVPGIILASVRLYNRNLSSIMEGSGWAINPRMRLTRRQRLHFTRKPCYPRGSRFERRWGWWSTRILLLTLLLALLAGRWLVTLF